MDKHTLREQIRALVVQYGDHEPNSGDNITDQIMALPMIAAAPRMLHVLKLVVAWGPGIRVPFVAEARDILREIEQ